jgi:hypothetical protein
MEWSEESQDSTLQDLMATRDSLRQEVSLLEARRDRWLSFSRRSTRDELAKAQATLATVEQRIVARQEEIRRERWHREQRERAQRVQLETQRALEREQTQRARPLHEQIHDLAERLRSINREHDHERDSERERGPSRDRGGYER